LRLFPLLLLAWPLAEIATFVVVGREIGVLSTIGLIVLTGFVGVILLRVQGFGVLRRARTEIDAGRDPSREIANGAMILVAGILLLLPGFLTDILGILLFIAPVREAVWRFLKTRIDVVTNFGASSARRGGSRGSRTIDLDPDEYSSSGSAKPDSPWRRLDRDD
jgi:UPF0716 protein FxsA